MRQILRPAASLSIGTGRRGRCVSSAAVALLSILASSASAQVPVPQLTSVFPPGGKAGTNFDVTTTGADQDEAVQLLFSHPGLVGKPKMATAEFHKSARPVPNAFEVSVAADVPPGTLEVRLVGRFGASAPRAFVVGRADETTDAGSNTARAAAQETRPGLTVNGRADANAVDYYKLKLAAGQRVLIECAAERIDSRMDATLAVLDASGRELARNRDTVGRDPLIDFTAPAEADYLIAVNDFLYRGGPEYFYRLTAHAEPHLDFVFPPCGPAGSNQPYTVYGRNLPGGKPAAGVAIEGTPLESITVHLALPADAANQANPAPAGLVPPQSALLDAVDYRLGASNPIRIGIAQAPVVTEQEPANNDGGTAQLVSVPCEYVGQFYPAGDLDWIEFAAAKGQILEIDVVAHRLGLESDPCLVLLKVNQAADGKVTLAEVANVDDPPERQGMIGNDFDLSTDDPSYRLVVPEDAKYRLLVRDQFGDARDDARFVYRLRIAPEQPDFRLAAVPLSPRGGQNPNQAVPDSLVLRRGEASLVKVVAARRGGFSGEIEITAEGLPAGVTCSGAVIGGDVSTAWLVFTAAEGAAAATAPLRIVGKATLQGQTTAVAARTGTGVWGAPDRQQAAPVFRLARDLVLSVVDQETAPISIAVGDGNVVETSRGGSLELPVRVTRRSGFAGEVKLVAEGMPNEIKPADLTVGGGAQDGKLTYALTNANAKPGTYTFYLKGEVKPKLPRNPNAEQLVAAEQKEVADALQAVTDQVKQATEALQQATKAAQEATAAVQQARQAKADEAAVAAAEQKAKAADEAKIQADAKLKELQETQKRADAAKKDVDKRLDDTKKANQPKDVTWPVISTPIKLRLRAAPFEMTTPAGPLNVKQGAGGEVALQLKKQFGFDDKVDLSFEPPPGVPGLGAKNVSIEKGQAEGKLALTIDKNAPEGQHTATVRARSKYNNVNVEATVSVVIQVEKAAP